jgi:hypothetical protein
MVVNRRNLARCTEPAPRRMYTGSGTWQGQGSSGACEDTWVAERRGPAGEAANPGPIYNYEPGAETNAAVAPSPACERFRSYDPATGTYLGYDGVRHACR